MKIYTLAERPDLRPALAEADAATYPQFLLHAELAESWGAVHEEFPEFQLVVCDDAGNALGHGNSVPFAWDGTPDGLPTSAVAMVELAREQRRAGVRPNVAGALQAVVHPAHQRFGLSRRVLAEMAATAVRHGLPDLFAPIRPSAKHLYPLVSLERYAGWTRDDGRPVDPWMRVHERLGAVPVKVAPEWATVTGTIADWERWTGMLFRETGPYVVPGALAPVEIDVERDLGRYVEPHLWMHYGLGLEETAAAA